MPCRGHVLIKLQCILLTLIKLLRRLLAYLGPLYPGECGSAKIHGPFPGQEHKRTTAPNPGRMKPSGPPDCSPDRPKAYFNLLGCHFYKKSLSSLDQMSPWLPGTYTLHVAHPSGRNWTAWAFTAVSQGRLYQEAGVRNQRQVLSPGISIAEAGVLPSWLNICSQASNISCVVVYKYIFFPFSFIWQRLNYSFTFGG